MNECFVCQLKTATLVTSLLHISVLFCITCKLQAAICPHCHRHAMCTVLFCVNTKTFFSKYNIVLFLIWFSLSDNICLHVNKFSHSSLIFFNCPSIVHWWNFWHVKYDNSERYEISVRTGLHRVRSRLVPPDIYCPSAHGVPQNEPSTCWGLGIYS